MFKKLLVLAVLAASLQARVVLDSDGKEVRIPDVIERATPMIWAFVQVSAMLGNEERIVSGAAKLPQLMAKIFPKIRTNDNKSGMLGSSVETLIASKTQVVFGPVGMLFDENSKTQLEQVGIAVVKIDKFATIKEIQDSFIKIAEIWSGKSVERAREFNAYFNKNVEFVKEKTAEIEPKKRVLVLNYNSGNFNTISSKDIGAEYISVAGGVNLSSELSKEDFKISKAINEEQVIIFNPDVIITNSRQSADAIAKNASFTKLKAVREGQIFVVPSGVYLWSVRSAEGALYPLWLAKTFYPEQFSDLNLEQKTREFYERFYNYKLSDGELKEILHPKGGF
ncbi:ABC transporter substrate-binding protein [Campylobacter concisus]|uniref:ABC transporter substrate-binding protein n=1 Tax=Campylobacter concisus TaxID=199 RepID=UPI00122C7E29|nr:ABC transporter substrate-binding protein [Campylobacter concisus]